MGLETDVDVDRSLDHCGESLTAEHAEKAENILKRKIFSALSAPSAVRMAETKIETQMSFEGTPWGASTNLRL